VACIRRRFVFVRNNSIPDKYKFHLSDAITNFYPNEMTTLSTVRAANAAFSPAYLPVALFVGGTSGIGQATAEALARYTKGEVHIIICGRNRTAAESIIASFPQSAKSRYEFVECDATLMKNVQATTRGLISTLPKLNFLFMSPGLLTLKGRDDTSEGLDKKLALHYYARWKFTSDLMPLLRKAKDAGEDAKVFSVLAAGRGGPIDLNDLGLKKGYSLLAAARTATTYNDLMIEVRPIILFEKYKWLTTFVVICRSASRHCFHSYVPRSRPNPPFEAQALDLQTSRPLITRFSVPVLLLDE
jgi:short chain dehydrogenase